MSEYLLWVDVETTGLDPETDELLEVAAVATDMSAELAPVADPFVVQIALDELQTLASIGLDVLEMHAANGLWRDARQDGVNDREAIRRFEVWSDAAEIRGLNQATVYLAGRSVHFDRSWLTRQGKNYLLYLKASHRHFDIRTLLTFAGIAGRPTPERPESEHRALPDVLADIEWTRALIRQSRA